jgi:5-methylcytosine-specific restriction endonuclease McrA
MMLEDLTGRTFGKYTVVQQVESKDWKRRWLCVCLCGEERIISTQHLTSGKRTGCNTCNNGNLKRPYEGRYNFLCAMAEGRTTVELTYEDYLTFTGITECHYCGVPIEWAPHGTFSNGHHLDRKNNSLGYSKGNCVVCCGSCNQTKSDKFTYEQFVQIGNLIRSWR